MQNFSPLASKLMEDERELVEGSAFYNIQKMHIYLISLARITAQEVFLGGSDTKEESVWRWEDGSLV